MDDDSGNILFDYLESRDKRTFCELCQGLTVAKLRPPNFYRHAENRAALQSSAKNCRLCDIIDRAIWREGVGTDYGPQLHFEGAVDASYFFSEQEKAERDSCPLKLALVPDNWRDNPRSKPSNKAPGFAYIGVWLKSKYIMTGLHLAVEEGDPLGRLGCAADDFHVSGRTIVSQEAPNDALFDVVRGWMDNCQKRHKPLNKTISGHCANVMASYRYVSLPHILTDIAILVLTLSSLYHLQISTKRKLGIFVTFAMGSLGIITSIVRFVSFYTVDLESDPTWYAPDLFSYTMIEPSAYFMCSCFPCLRPLMRDVYKGMRAKIDSHHGSASDRSDDTDLPLCNIKGSHRTSISVPKSVSRRLDDDDDRSHFIRLEESVNVDVAPRYAGGGA